MRPPLVRLLIVLLAWCVGFQSTAAAAGMRCSHEADSTTVAGAMPAGMHHGAGMKMDQAAADPHAHHRAGAQAKAPGEVKTGIATLGCECGCNCASVGCVVSGLGIVGVNLDSFFDVMPARFVVQHAQNGLRMAHGLDLIRPPSKS